jgi:sugar/nucleoside kinase (ribokinase family)
MSQLDLLVLGDVNPDVVVRSPGVEVRFGQVEQLVESAALSLGGSGAIVAMGSARLGLRVGLCAVVGADDLGALVLSQLHDRRVGVEHLVSTTAAPTGMSVIVDRGDDRAVLTAAGAIPLLSADLLAGLPDQPARHVHAASYYLMSPEYREALPGALRRFRAAGVTTSLDTNWDPQGQWDLGDVLEQTDVFLPNEAELMAVAGSPVIDRAVDLIGEHGCEVAVKRGRAGAVARAADRIYRLPRTPPVDFVDAVGAGDTFDAGYLAGRLAGRDPGGCLAMAVIAGTLSTRAAGGTAGQPELSEVEPWLRKLRPTEERAEDNPREAGRP